MAAHVSIERVRLAHVHHSIRKKVRNEDHDLKKPPQSYWPDLYFEGSEQTARPGS